MNLEQYRKSREAYEKKVDEINRRMRAWKIAARVLTFVTMPPVVCLALVYGFDMEGKYAAVGGGLLSVALIRSILDKIDWWLYDGTSRAAMRLHDELFSGANGGAR